jgi:hypothetical protein
LQLMKFIKLLMRILVLLWEQMCSKKNRSKSRGELNFPRASWTVKYKEENSVNYDSGNSFALSARRVQKIVALETMIN